MSISDRDGVLAHVGALIRQWQIQPAELSGFYLQPSTVDKPSRNLIPEIIAYFGALLMVTGISVYIGMQWGHFNTAARIIVTLGSGTALLVIGLIAVVQNTWVKARTIIFLLAAALQTTGILVTLHEFYPNSNDTYMAGIVTSFFMLLAQLGVLSRYRQPVILFLALFFGYALFWSVMGKLSVNHIVANIAGSISMLFLARNFQLKGDTRLSVALYAIGSTILLYAAFDWLENTPFEIAYFGLAAGVVYASAAYRSTALLITGSLAVLGFLSYFTAQHFVNVIGWPIALIILGAVFLAGGNMAWKIQRRYIKPAGN